MIPKLNTASIVQRPASAMPSDDVLREVVRAVYDQLVDDIKTGKLVLRPELLEAIRMRRRR